MCSTGNRQTRTISDIRIILFMDHLRSGIKVTLNTDIMGIEGTAPAKEYRCM